MIAGKRFYGEEMRESEESKQFRDLISEIFMYGGATNPGDFLPILRWFDYGNLEKNLRRFSEKMDLYLQGLIDEHRSDKNVNSMLNHLLSLQESQPDYYADHIIKGLIMVTSLSLSLSLSHTRCQSGLL